MYENESGFECLKALSDMHNLVSWVDFLKNYCYHRYGDENDNTFKPFKEIKKVQKCYLELKEKLSAEKWVNDEYREEMLIAAEGICVMAELMTKRQKGEVERLTSTNEWLKRYSDKWMAKNKRSELYNIKEAFEYCENNF